MPTTKTVKKAPTKKVAPRSKKPPTKRASKKTSESQIIRLPAVVGPYSQALKTKRSATFSAFVSDSSNLFGPGRREESFDKLLNKYGESTTWVYVCVNRIANAFAQIPLRIVKKTNPNIIITKRDNGLSDLLSRPNKFQSYFDFAECCMDSLELTGNLFIEKSEMDKQGRPKELYVLNPSRMSIIPSKKDFIAGYVFNINGEEVPFAADDIIHIKYSHPNNDYWGLAPLTAARVAISTDQGALEWNRNFMLKGGWPSGALMTENELDQTSLRRLKKNVKDMLQRGKDQAGRILVLTGGLKYDAIAVSPKDMDWLAARRFARDEILAIHNVPFAIAGIYATEQTTARSAGVLQQIKTFYQLNIFPKVIRFMQALNRELVPAFSPMFALQADFRAVPALADDLARELLRAQIFRILVGSGWSIEMALGELYPHMKAPPWGKVAWMNSSMVPISGPENPALNQQKPTDDDDEDEEEESAGKRLAYTLGINGGADDALDRIVQAQIDNGTLDADTLDNIMKREGA